MAVVLRHAKKGCRKNQETYQLCWSKGSFGHLSDDVAVQDKNKRGSILTHQSEALVIGNLKSPQWSSLQQIGRPAGSSWALISFVADRRS